MLQAIEKHISNLLHQHDCVIIPGLGGFVANYMPAMVDGELVKPPFKGLIWNRFLQHNDGLLANEIAKKSNVSYEIANQEIANFVSVVTSNLKDSKRYDFDLIGFLYHDSSGQIMFEFSGKNFLMNSFGLPIVKLTKIPVLQAVVEETKVIDLQLVSEEVDKDKQAKVIQINEPRIVEKVITRNSKWWIAAALIPIGFYSAWIPMKTDLLNGGDNFHYSDLNPFTYNKSKGNYKMINDYMTIVDTLPSVSFEPFELFQPNISEIQNQENSVLSAESTYVEVITPVVVNVEKPSSTGSYFVIGGCFSDEANALSFVDQLKSKGFDAKLVDVNKGLHRVAFGQYETKDSAKKAQEEIMASGDYSAWVLKK